MIQQFGEFADGVMFWSVLRYGEALMEESEGNIKTSLFEGGYSMVDSKVVRKRIKAIADEFFKAYKGIDVTVVLSSSNPLTVYLAGVIGQRCVDPFFISDFLAKLYFEEVDDLIYEENSWFRKHYGDKYWERYEEFKNYSDKMIDPGFQFKKITDLEMRGVIEETIKSGDAFYAKYIDAINDKNVLVVEDRITLDGEYKRDRSKNLPIDLPKNYYPNNDPENRPLLTWRAHGNNLYTNWLNYYVYQVTPYDLDGTPDFSHK